MLQQKKLRRFWYLNGQCHEIFDLLFFLLTLNSKWAFAKMFFFFKTVFYCLNGALVELFCKNFSKMSRHCPFNQDLFVLFWKYIWRNSLKNLKKEKTDCHKSSIGIFPHDKKELNKFFFLGTPAGRRSPSAEKINQKQPKNRYIFI